MQEHFLSCDWGTSSFRIRLIRTSTLEIIQFEEDAQLGFGQQSLTPADYLQQFEQKTKALCAKARLEKLPCAILSGMASSSIGIKNLPYGKLPLPLNDFHLPYERLAGLSTEAYLISGLSTGEDIMRGEEVQVLGAVQKLVEPDQNYLIILPGTHSKHVIIEQNQLLSFKTYMTGELFSLLQTHSILKHSVHKEKIDLQNPKVYEAFMHGIQKSSVSLLHELFTIRARQILQHTDPLANYAFLSGLLIGSELRSIDIAGAGSFIVCADMPMLDLYRFAILKLFPEISLRLVGTREATILGHHKLLQQIQTI
ncbi:2-dehydro-3-deoxygalactonokinase [Catalinimonas niigatensis]|uniref:2-dehydro-3-deoxygalactonokinase n=1 Tax=Catalinimonas niigatensis TaxID=1397264 RepID=UPI00266652C1|nr:2-dehydro-3-deoxygalactonokinase [Catalinimonas niigatensis]WPP51695.1 2-dehydro-3-deoxygalactonokinase [Catalinimonas niigatensis]